MGGKSTTSTQTTTIPKEVLERYSAVNKIAETAAQTPFQQYGGQFVAPTNVQQQAGFENINQAAGQAQPYFQGAAGMTLAGSQGVGQLGGADIQRYMSPYLQSVLQPTLALQKQAQEQQMAGQTGAAIRSGAFGGDRAGIAAANLAQQNQLALGKTAGDILSSGYGQAVQTATGQQGVEAANLARLQAGGQQLGGLGAAAQTAGLQGAQAQVGAGTLQQQTQQALDTAKYQQFLQERGYPFQTAQFLANIAVPMGAASGSTTTMTQPQSLFSDERLKENITQVGELNDGQPIYRYNYKGDPKTQIGLIAQDVEQSHPEAVGLAGGYRTVDYGKATDEAASMGGAVTQPGAYARGGYADGGMLDALVAQHQQMYAPMAGAQSGGLGAGSPYKQGYIPASQMPSVKAPSASASFTRQPSGLEQAMKGYETASSLGKMWDAGDKTLFGSAATRGTAENPGEAAKAGVLGIGNKFDPQAGYAAKAINFISGAAPADISGISDTMFRARGGLVPEGYAMGGMPYATDGDPMSQVVEEGQKGLASAAAPKGAQMPGQTRGIGNDITDAVKLGSSLYSAGSSAAAAVPAVLSFLASFSDARLKDNIEPVGKLYDGQPVYRYDMGGGPTQIGLMAQNVERTNPDAVGLAGGYKTVDYGRATENAARGGFAGGGEVDVPEEYRPMLEQASRETGIPVSILAKQVRTESGFNPNAIGKAGEIGLGQILPSTARQPGYGVRPVDPESLRDPEQNINFQARYLAGRGRAAGVEDWNNPEQAAKGVGAYNAGDPSYARRVLGGGLGNAMAMAPERAPTSAEGAIEKASPAGGLGAGLQSMLPKKEGTEETNWKQVLIPLLTGIGAAATTPTRNWGTALASGLGAGAQAYSGLEKQQAEVKKVEAETRGKETETFQKSLMQTPFGNVVWLANGSLMPLGDYDKLSKSGSAPALLGRIPDNAPEVLRKWREAQATVKNEPVPGEVAKPATAPATAPVTPVERAQLPPSGVGYDQDSTSAAAKEKSVVLSGGTEANTAKNITEKYINSVVPMATAARDSSRYLTELATNLAEATKGKGLDAPGFGFDARAQATSALNTLSRAFGGSGDFGRADSISEINRKIETLQAAVQAAGGNQESFAALNALRQAIASPNMSPRAYSKLSADMLVQNQRAIDRDQHRAVYGQDSGGYFAQAGQDFERTNPASKYNQEAEVIQRMILTQPQLIKDLRAGKYTPKQIDEAFDKFGVKGMSRYFVGGR